ncbi:hypothetical protein ACW9HQ_39020, partial [Nocardia gipuzkoensis]
PERLSGLSRPDAADAATALHDVMTGLPPGEPRVVRDASGQHAWLLHHRAFESQALDRGHVTPAAERFLRVRPDGRVEVMDHDIGRSALQSLRDRVRSVRPDFEAMGRGRWHDDALARLDELVAHARPDPVHEDDVLDLRRRAADGSDDTPTGPTRRRTDEAEDRSTAPTRRSGSEPDDPPTAPTRRRTSEPEDPPTAPTRRRTDQAGNENPTRRADFTEDPEDPPTLRTRRDGHVPQGDGSGQPHEDGPRAPEPPMRLQRSGDWDAARGMSDGVGRVGRDETADGSRQERATP